MHLIWHGTASVEVVSEAGGRILFDPFVPLPGSDVPVKLADFDGFSEIFVTHGHIDHIVHLPQIAARNPDVRIHCTETPYRTLLKKGVPAKNLDLLRFGDVREMNGFRIRALHGRHAVLPKASRKRVLYALRSPARRNLPFILRAVLVCRENDETVFYQIEADGRTLSVMGSMNLRPDEQYPTGADLLVLPYNGWEDNLPPAVGIIERLQPKRVVLDHYDDTFPPLTMPLDLSPILDRFPETVTALALNKKEDV